MIHMLPLYAIFFKMSKSANAGKEASRHMLRRIAHFHHVISIVDLRHSPLATDH